MVSAGKHHLPAGIAGVHLASFVSHGRGRWLCSCSDTSGGSDHSSCPWGQALELLGSSGVSFPPCFPWAVISPHHSVPGVLSGEPSSWTPFACTIYMYFHLIQKCLFSPRPFSRTLWRRSTSDLTLTETKTRGSHFPSPHQLLGLFTTSENSEKSLLAVELSLVLCWVPRLLHIPLAAKGRKRSSLRSQPGVPAYTLVQPPGKHPCLHEGLELPPLQISREMCRTEGRKKKDHKFSVSGWFTYLEWAPGEIADTPIYPGSFRHFRANSTDPAERHLPSQPGKLAPSLPVLSPPISLHPASSSPLPSRPVPQSLTSPLKTQLWCLLGFPI